ncbi:AAA family ATPase [Gordonia sp. HNM0687]|uniref:AAA family ATPase n=1 Tax=Gordonia mangrovi TaxID=2665643 RepID=A0A6L7GP24_9ACTN|nr:AAA family ATPase [Gordonia mangrovi]MXP21626.1 AAA family ATPase [Gordonia mangrovi]UVF80366.1 AAA family ATPase [Gordonia mangrovi]
MNAPTDTEPRAELARRLDVLYSDAGSPPLKAVSARATRELRARDPRGRDITAQRISDWRLGRSVPAKFDGLGSVLSVLIVAARRHHPEPSVPGLYSAPEWRHLWERARSPGQRPAVEEKCPYPGLAALTIGDSEYFAGRESQIATMRARFAETSSAGEILVLVGASGAGKSSLLQAGFAARIRDDVDVLLVTPTAVGTDDLESWLRDRASESTPYVVAVDQLEELFVAPFDDAAAGAYLEQLAGLATPGEARPGECAGVVAALRADFYPAAARYPILAKALQHNQMLLSPPTADELTAAIVEPARAQGLTVGDGLVELILADLGVRGDSAPEAARTGTFPLLAHTLRSMWEYREGKVLGVPAYEKAGGVRGAIATSAETLWDSFDVRQQETARTILLQLVTPVPDGSAVGRRVDREDLYRPFADRAPVDSVLEALADARIITHDAHGTSLSHDAVISAWPRLSEWVEEDREDAVTRLRIQGDADDWVAADRDRALLYRGNRLTAADDLVTRSPSALSPRAAEFIDAAQTVRRQQRNAFRALAVFLVVGVIVTSVLAVVSMRQSQRAERERADAQYAALIASGLRDQSVNPTESAQLALAATTERPGDPAARGLLLASQSSPLAATFDAHAGAIYGTAQSPAGVIASGGYDNTVRLWRHDTDRGLVPVGAPLSTASWVTAVGFSPDGTVLYATGATGVVVRWDVGDPARPVPMDDIDVGHRGTVYALSVRSDGRWIATAGDDRTVRLHDIGSGQTRVLTGHTAPVRTVAFRPDGNMLVSGADDRTARVWDTVAPAQASPIGVPLTGQTLTIHSAAFSPDGTMLATGSDDQTFRLWSVRDGGVVPLGAPVNAHSAALWSVAFSADGTALATAAWDGTAALWSLVDPTHPIRLGQPMTGSRGGLTTVTFVDGTQVLTGGQDGQLRVWTLSPATVAGHTRRVQAPTFDSAGTLMATGSWDGQVLLWDVTGTRPTQISAIRPDGGDVRVENVELSPDGRTLAVTALDSGDVALYDTSDPRQPRFAALVANPGARYTHELAFSPDSSALATASDDSSVQIWDVTDRARPVARGEPLTGPRGWVNAVTFTPDGSRLFAASADQRLYLWDLPGGDPAGRVVAEQDGPINTLSINADGTLLAAAGDDRAIRVLRVDDALSEVAQLRGHDSTVRSVSFDPTTGLLASGADDQTVRLWSLDDPQEPQAIGRSLTPPGTVRWQVAFDPRGRLSAGGETGALRWWSTDEEDTAERVCSATQGTELGADQEIWSDELADACS